MQTTGLTLWIRMILLLRRVRLWLRHPHVFEHALRRLGTTLVEQIRQQLPPQDDPLGVPPLEDN